MHESQSARLVRPWAASLTITLLAACRPVATTLPPPPPANGVSASPAAATRPFVVATTPVTSARPCPEVVKFDVHLAAQKIPAADIAKVRKTLLAPRTDHSRSPDSQHAEALTKSMSDPLPALAHLLTDIDLGDTVAFTMFEIDEDRAAPWVFASIPRSDRNVQFHSFSRFLRLAFAEQPPCWNAVVRDAARRTLTEGTNADAAEQALYALGVTGSADDIRLLRKYADNRDPVEMWRKRLRDAAQAALARQGDRTAIDAIRHELDVPVDRTIDFDGARARAAALDKAGFSRQRSLATLVCRHLASPAPAPSGHMLAPRPAAHAAMALGHIVDNRPPDDPNAVVETWAKRCTSGGV